MVASKMVTSRKVLERVHNRHKIVVLESTCPKWVHYWICMSEQIELGIGEHIRGKCGESD